MPPPVMNCGELPRAVTVDLLGRYGLEARHVANGRSISGTFWGEPEAGLVGSCIYYRDDTPVHSLLHEAAHYICMTPERRAGLDTDAGGDDPEECAVCYLEVLLADFLPPFTAARCLADMDTWGYSFREGSARAWFDGDGRDARDWLLTRALIDERDQPTYNLVGFGASP